MALDERDVRVAGAADLAGVSATLTLAFATDPLWSWAFPEIDALGRWWSFLLASALKHEWVWVLDDYAAVSVWIPPGQDELSPQEEQQAEVLLEELIGARAADVMGVLSRFEDTHPKDVPHYYLTLLGTHPDRRGRGLGMGLLAENLRRIDAEGMPAYLESSNPGNVPRYEAVGFVPVGEFDRPDGAVKVTTMWREPQPV